MPYLLHLNLQPLQAPMWPFLVASEFVGSFAILPYLYIWEPPPPGSIKVPPELPPPPRERNVPEALKARVQRWLIEASESRWMHALCMGTTLFLASFLLVANTPTWQNFWYLVRASRFVHVMLLDFISLCAVTPFLVWRDAQLRGVTGTELWVYVGLSAALPMVGAQFYLIMRPISQSAAGEPQVVMYLLMLVLLTCLHRYQSRAWLLC